MKEVLALAERAIKVGEAYAKKYGYKAGSMHEIIPEFRSRTVCIRHKKYDEDKLYFDNIRSIVNGNAERVTPPGTYTVLETRTAEPDMFDRIISKGGKGWEVMMSDTPYELLSSSRFIMAAHGDVLIIGLGLGATTLPVLKKKTVKSVTVIELNKNVIKAVEGPLRKALTKQQNKKFRVINANGRTWEGDGRPYNTIWIDIWPDVSLANRTDLKRLKVKYRGFHPADADSWIGAWEEERLDAWHHEEKSKPDPFAAVGGDVRKAFKSVNGIKL
jgi:hypothetical protein